MKRAWTLTISVVVGATAGWAAYFAWQYRNFVGGQELVAALVGAAVAVGVWAATVARSNA